MNHLAPKEVKDKVEQLLEQKFDNDFKPSKLLDAMKYATLIGGKRIRPELIVQTGRMLGCIDEDLLFEVSCGFEMCHASTLLIDDLPCMDDDDIRRGELTTHKVFPLSTTILAGGCLQIAGTGIVHTVMPSLVPEITQAFGANGCSYGQELDMKAVGTVQDLDYQEEMNSGKTGALLESAVRIGYLCANAPKETTDILDSVSFKAGLLFQIHNDILDVVGYDGRHGEDARMNKLTTYPNKFGLDEALNKRDELFKETISELKTLSAKYDTTNLENAIEFIAYRDY